MPSASASPVFSSANVAAAPPDALFGLVRDFKNDVDTLAIDRDMVDGNSLSAALAHGRINSSGDAVFDFGDGHKLIVRDVGTLDILANDLILI